MSAVAEPRAPESVASSGREAASLPRGLFLLFFLSGAAGLVYQVVWTRMLTLVFGATVYAVSAVLTVFMAGLAAGSLVLGRRADRPGADLLRLYGRLEIGIGLYCAVSPFLIGLVKTLYVAAAPALGKDFTGFSLFRFALSVIVLAVPTFLMGGTLPILAKYVVRRFDALGAGVGTLYAVNTAGAVIGSFLAGYVLLAAIGVRATIGLAVVANVGVGLAALAMARAAGARSPALAPADGATAASAAPSATEDAPAAEPAHGGAPAPRSLTEHGALALLFVSGLAALVYEVAWSRLLGQVLGSSVYAVSAMLTTFLTGIALGSLVATRAVDRVKNPAGLLALLEVGIGISALAATPLLDRLPLFFLALSGLFGPGFGSSAFVHFLVSAFVMVLPTLLMGAAFPVAARIYARDLAHLGRAVGVVYSWNTVGAILGAFLGGFVFLPGLGMQRTILFASGANVIAGSLYLFAARGTRPVVRALVPAVGLAAFGALALFGPEWDRYLLNFGAFDSPGYYRELIRAKGLREVVYSYEIRYYEEGLNSNVAVSQEGESLFLQINGRTEASTTADMPNQLLAAHIPLLLHPQPREACLIGLGSGITLGSMLLHPLANVDCVEISPEVVAAAGYFSEHDYNALADPRARLVQDDGRNFLLASKKKYDVLISEPSKPWITGVSNLFTKDYYELCLSRLDEDGIMCQWCHYYSMSPEDFKTILRTYASVFPYVQLWNVGRDVFLLGSRTALPIDADILVKKMDDRKIVFDLSRVGVRSPFDVVKFFVFADADLREFIGKGTINTDDRPVIEFSAPRNLSVYKQEQIFDSMMRFRPRFNGYPLLRQVVELAEARGFAYPLANLRYLTESVRLAPQMAGIVRTVKPEPDSTGAPIVSFRREAFFGCEDGGTLAFASIEQASFPDSLLDSALDKMVGTAVEWGSARIRDHDARWVLRRGAGPDDLLLAISWHCVENRCQFMLTRKFSGAANKQKILDEVIASTRCIHAGKETL
jgi:spermidine synthase